MPAGELYIKLPKAAQWKDAFTEYGVSLQESALSKLMTPAPNKEVVENESDLENGKRVLRDTERTRKDERNVSLAINMVASSQSDFLSKYGRFCTEVLDKGFFDLKTKYQSGVVYRMTYLDCTQFSEFNLGIAQFTLSLNEPDPTDREE